MPDHEWIVTPPTCWAAIPVGAVTATFPSPVYFFLSSEMMYLNRNDFPVPAPPVKKTLRPPIATSAACTWSAVRSSFFGGAGPGGSSTLAFLPRGAVASPLLLGDALPRLAVERRARGAAAVLGADAHDVLAVLFRFVRPMPAAARCCVRVGLASTMASIVLSSNTQKAGLPSATRTVGDELVAERHVFWLLGCGSVLLNRAACASFKRDWARREYAALNQQRAETRARGGAPL